MRGRVLTFLSCKPWEPKVAIKPRSADMSHRLTALCRWVLCRPHLHRYRYQVPPPALVASQPIQSVGAGRAGGLRGAAGRLGAGRAYMTGQAAR